MSVHSIVGTLIGLGIGYLLTMRFCAFVAFRESIRGFRGLHATTRLDLAVSVDPRRHAAFRRLAALLLYRTLRQWRGLWRQAWLERDGVP